MYLAEPPIAYDSFLQAAPVPVFAIAEEVSLGGSAPEVKVRKEFPEAWIWESLDDIGYL